MYDQHAYNVPGKDHYLFFLLDSPAEQGIGWFASNSFKYDGMAVSRSIQVL